MPISAYLFPITPRLDWERATVPGSSLEAVNPTDPIDVTQYAARDNELAYRDVVVAAAVSRVALKAADIWGYSAPHPVISTAPAATLNDNEGSPASPGSVAYVDNQSVPYDAVTTDLNLYARDTILYQALYDLADTTFGTQNPLTALTMPLTVTDAWSYANSLESDAGIGLNLSLDTGLFANPDKHLAWRDNVLAGYAARLQESLSKVWELAQRILIQVVDDLGILHESEVYAFISDDGRYRRWGAAPKLPNQLQVVYDRQVNGITWVGERLGQAGSPQLAAPNLVVGGSLVERKSDQQAKSDSEFFRQKSARLPMKNFIDTTVYATRQPNDHILSGGLYQLDSALMTIPGVVSFDLPIIVPPGCVRIGLLVKPATNFSLLGFQNTSGLSDGTGVTLTSAATVTWQAALPGHLDTSGLAAGRLYFSLTMTDKTAATAAFAVKVRYNSVLIFDGSYVFNEPAGTAHETQAVEFYSDGSVADFSVEWTGGSGQLTIESVNFVVEGSGVTNTNYFLGAQLGGEAVARPIQFAGMAERLDVTLFDVVVTEEMIQPQLTLTWIGGGGMVLFVYGYDIKVFNLVQPVTDSENYAAYKASLAQRAIGSVQGAYARYLMTNPATELRITDVIYGYVWDSVAYATWLTAIRGYGESRLDSAFQIAGPSDIGRPALVPEGLECISGSTVAARYGSVKSVPVFRALQPWMLAFGVKIAGPDFWPLDHPGCSWYGPLETIGVTAGFEISVPPATGTGPQIGNLVVLQHIVGSPDVSGNRAYTAVNVGPSGGTTIQTVIYSIWMINLRIGATYTLTIGLVTSPITGTMAAGITSSVVINFAAESENQVYSPDPIQASSGHQVWLQSATLS